jgi:hypothetical protein
MADSVATNKAHLAGLLDEIQGALDESRRQLDLTESFEESRTVELSDAIWDLNEKSSAPLGFLVQARQFNSAPGETRTMRRRIPVERIRGLVSAHTPFGFVVDVTEPEAWCDAVGVVDAVFDAAPGRDATFPPIGDAVEAVVIGFSGGGLRLSRRREYFDAMADASSNLNGNA